MTYARIFYADGDTGRAIVDALTHSGGAVIHSASPASVDAVLDHLAQWDTGEYDDLHDQPAHGTWDTLVQRDAYLLTWNTGLGYVGLEVAMDAMTGRPIEVETCRGCDQPVDYCTDHTHVPDTQADEYVTDYDAVTAKLALAHA